MTNEEIREKLKRLDRCILAYTSGLVDWDPDVMYADETGSRTPYERDEIENLVRELKDKVNLDDRLRRIREGDRALVVHAKEMWEIYRANRRDVERKEEKIPTSRWWWYLDKPEVWPPLEPI